MTQAPVEPAGFDLAEKIEVMNLLAAVVTVTQNHVELQERLIGAIKSRNLQKQGRLKRLIAENADRLLVVRDQAQDFLDNVQKELDDFGI